MGIIINPRGCSGSGKTEFVRRIMADYGTVGGAEPIFRAGRTRPIGYVLAHPLGGNPLAVIGHYEKTSGGCDTISLRDGGMETVFRLADAYAGDGHDVLIEGQRLSSEHAGSRALARRRRLCVLHLDVPPDICARNLAMRRRMRRDSWPAIAQTTRPQAEAVAEACQRLAPVASVLRLGFDDAVAEARQLLGVEEDWRVATARGAQSLPISACAAAGARSLAPEMK